MAFIARITGQVRGIREVTKKDTGEIMARNVSVLTEAGDHLGETVRVTVWDRDHGRVAFEQGQTVDLIVEVGKSERFGLEVTMRGLGSELPASAPALAGAGL